MIMMAITNNIEEIALKYALQNAYKYNGKAQIKPVIQKIVSELPNLRPYIKAVIPIVEKIILKVNSMTYEDQIKLIREQYPDILLKEKPRKHHKVLPPLPNVEKYKVIRTRFAPNPDAPLHLGSARPIILSYEYAKMYNGQFILRFEDTDPKTKPPVLDAYEWIKSDLRWLDVKWDEEYYQSDRLPIYYHFSKILIEKEAAYVCTCRKEVFRELINKGYSCPCRSLTSEENLERWDKMLNGVFKEGEAVVRIKTDLTHPNPALRDWPALRIINTEKFPHPRTGSKYHVWPLYNFSCGIDDHEMMITHIIRAKEHIINTLRQRYLYMHLGWSYPETIHHGRMKIQGVMLSKSKIKLGIQKGIFEGWDDPRLGTLMALRRRGFLPETIKQIIIDVGIKPTETSIDWTNISAINRKFLDPKAKRLFFVETPIKIAIHNVNKDYICEIPYHPEKADMGFRTYQFKRGTVEVYISLSDARTFKPGLNIRLMNLFNVKVTDISSNRVEALYLNDDHEEAVKYEYPIIQWVPVNDSIYSCVVMPNGQRIHGLCEGIGKTLNVDEVIQLVRFGFVRVDDIKPDKIIFYYTHN
jgi:glutamyl-tRNA synthetase